MLKPFLDYILSNSTILQHPYCRASESSIELIVYNNESSIRAGSI